MDCFYSETHGLPDADISEGYVLKSSPPSSKDFASGPGALIKAGIAGYSSHGRISPGHDLGYHTLLTGQSLMPTPNQTPTVGRRSYDSPPEIPTSPWSDMPSSRASPFTPSLEASPMRTGTSKPFNHSGLSDTEKLMTTFKGKKPPKASPFDRLTDELILRIFSYLSSNHLCVCARVCRRWYFLAWEPQLWTTISLSSDKINIDRGLKTLFRLLCRDSPSVCLTVEKIYLNGCLRLSDKGLITIARKCPELRTLEIKGCSNVSNAGVCELVSKCVSLERLDLTGCYRVNIIQPRQCGPAPQEHEGPSSAESLPPQAPRQMYLQYLDMTECHGLDDSGLKVIVRNCPQVTHLYLRRCVHITDAGVKYVASYCMMLRELSVSDCLQVTDFGMYELAKLGPNLRYLSVAKCDQISDAGIKQIARHCYKLRYLNVRGCEAVSDDSIGVLARSCPRLRALDIGKCDVTDHGLKLISEHCPNLRKLSVKSCEMITDKGIQSVAYYCRGLQQLSIQDCNITVEGYRTVKRFCKRCIIEHTNPGFY